MAARAGCPPKGRAFAGLGPQRNLSGIEDRGACTGSREAIGRGGRHMAVLIRAQAPCLRPR
ncbi:hypothetical protein F01_10030 [Burkholderia cenocepacia]|nr:hypothetical protein F01_10030 [Burkholderia cenocepacia]